MDKAGDVEVHGKSIDHFSGSVMTCIEENVPNAMPSTCNQSPSDAAHPLICSINDCESQGLIDWSKLVIDANVDENDDRDVVLEEDAMYEFIGLRAEDERREPIVNPLPPELEAEINDASMEVDDNVVEHIEYMDEENPTMNVGDTYPTMEAFRMAMRQFAIKGQFDVYTVQSDQTRFKGKCKGKGCLWQINAHRTMDGRAIRVLKI